MHISHLSHVPHALPVSGGTHRVPDGHHHTWQFDGAIPENWTQYYAPITEPLTHAVDQLTHQALLTELSSDATTATHINDATTRVTHVIHALSGHTDVTADALFLDALDHIQGLSTQLQTLITTSNQAIGALTADHAATAAQAGQLSSGVAHTVDAVAQASQALNQLLGQLHQKLGVGTVPASLLDRWTQVSDTLATTLKTVDETQAGLAEAIESQQASASEHIAHMLTDMASGYGKGGAPGLAMGAAAEGPMIYATGQHYNHIHEQLVALDTQLKTALASGQGVQTWTHHIATDIAQRPVSDDAVTLSDSIAYLNDALTIAAGYQSTVSPTVIAALHQAVLDLGTRTFL